MDTQHELSFEQAVFHGDLEQTKNYLAVLTIDQINKKNTKGQTALYTASRKGHDAIVEALLQVPNIDVNAQDIHGRTALHAASIFAQPKVLSHLLSYGCDTNLHSVTTSSTAFEEARGLSINVWKLYKEGGTKALKQNNYPVVERLHNPVLRTVSGDNKAKKKFTKAPSAPKLPKFKPNSPLPTRLENFSPLTESSTLKPLPLIMDIKESISKLEKLYYQAVSAATATLQGQADEAKLYETHVQALHGIVSLTKASSSFMSSIPEVPNMSQKYSYLTYFLPPNKEDLPPVIEDKSSVQFVVEQQTKTFDPNSYKLNIVPDVYTRDFIDKEHMKFIRISGEKKDEKYIIIVASNSQLDLHCGLIISKKGYQEIVVDVKRGEPTEKTVKRVLRFLQARYPKDEIQYFDDPDNLFSKVIQKIEVNSPQIKSELKIGIIYAKQGQVNPHEMFKNTISKSFQNFLNAMEIDPKQSTEKWNESTVHWYISPYLSADEHRRDVGNAPSIIFFQDEGKPFDATQVQELGMVPQIFIVVQPAYRDMGYRVGFFRSGNLHAFDPMVPTNHIFLPWTLKDFLLTKVYNGNVMFCHCSPMNRGFLLKRASDIQAVLDNKSHNIN